MRYKCIRNIDKILKVTGMSYEECFKEGLNEDKEN